nr:hypothetical protein [Micromonospora kangleipakensis]
MRRTCHPARSCTSPRSVVYVAPVGNRDDVYVAPVIHSLGYIGRATRLRLGERVERRRKLTPTLKGEIPHNRAAVYGDVGDVPLIATPDDAEAGKLSQVPLHRADRLAGVVSEALLRRVRATAVGVRVVGEPDQDGHARRGYVGRIVERPRDSLDAHREPPRVVRLRRYSERPRAGPA